MRALSRQKGMTFTVLAFVIAVGITAFIIGIKLAPVYMQYYTVKSVIQDVAKEPGSAGKSHVEIWRALERRFDVNSIDVVRQEHITIVKHATGASIQLAYEVRKPLIGNVDAVVVFEHSAPLQ